MSSPSNSSPHYFVSSSRKVLPKMLLWIVSLICMSITGTTRANDMMPCPTCMWIPSVIGPNDDVRVEGEESCDAFLRGSICAEFTDDSGAVRRECCIRDEDRYSNQNFSCVAEVTIIRGGGEDEIGGGGGESTSECLEDSCLSDPL